MVKMYGDNNKIEVICCQGKAVYWKTSRYAINMKPRNGKVLTVIYYTSNMGINRIGVNFH